MGAELTVTDAIAIVLGSFALLAFLVGCLYCWTIRCRKDKARDVEEESWNKVTRLQPWDEPLLLHDGLTMSKPGRPSVADDEQLAGTVADPDASYSPPIVPPTELPAISSAPLRDGEHFCCFLWSFQAYASWNERRARDTTRSAALSRSDSAVVDVDSLCATWSSRPLSSVAARTHAWVHVPGSSRPRVWDTLLNTFHREHTEGTALDPPAVASHLPAAPRSADFLRQEVRRCRFPELRSGPGGARLLRLLQRWQSIAAVEGLAYWQPVGYVAATVARVYLPIQARQPIAVRQNAALPASEPPDPRTVPEHPSEHRALRTLLAISRVFLGAVLSEGHLAKLAEVRRLSALLQVLGFWDPALATALMDASLEPEFFALSWVSGLWADNWDFSALLIVWDVAFCVGPRFPLFFAAALLHAIRRRLLGANQLTGMELLAALKRGSLFVPWEMCLEQAVRWWSFSPASLGELDRSPGGHRWLRRRAAPPPITLQLAPFGGHASFIEEGEEGEEWEDGEEGGGGGGGGEEGREGTVSNGTRSVAGMPAAAASVGTPTPSSREAIRDGALTGLVPPSLPPPQHTPMGRRGHSIQYSARSTASIASRASSSSSSSSSPVDDSDVSSDGEAELVHLPKPWAMALSQTGRGPPKKAMERRVAVWAAFLRPATPAAAALSIAGLFRAVRASPPPSSGRQSDAMGTFWRDSPTRRSGSIGGGGGGGGSSGQHSAFPSLRIPAAMAARDLQLGEVLPVVRRQELPQLRPATVVVLDLREADAGATGALAQLLGGGSEDTRLGRSPVEVAGAGAASAGHGSGRFPSDDPLYPRRRAPQVRVVAVDPNDFLAGAARMLRFGEDGADEPAADRWSTVGMPPPLAVGGGTSGRPSRVISETSITVDGGSHPLNRSLNSSPAPSLPTDTHTDTAATVNSFLRESIARLEAASEGASFLPADPSLLTSDPRSRSLSSPHRSRRGSPAAAARSTRPRGGTGGAATATLASPSPEDRAATPAGPSSGSGVERTTSTTSREPVRVRVPKPQEGRPAASKTVRLSSATVIPSLQEALEVAPQDSAARKVVEWCEKSSLRCRAVGPLPEGATDTWVAEHRTCCRRSPTVPPSSELAAWWVRQRAPALASARGACVVLYVDCVAHALATRDILWRAGFPGVCCLSHLSLMED